MEVSPAHPKSENGRIRASVVADVTQLQQEEEAPDPNVEAMGRPN